MPLTGLHRAVFKGNVDGFDLLGDGVVDVDGGRGGAGQVAVVHARGAHGHGGHPAVVEVDAGGLAVI